MFIGVSLVMLLIALALIVIRVLTGPTLGDRLLAASMMGSKMVLLIPVAGGYSYVFDLSLVYALINFVSIVGILQLLRAKEKEIDSASSRNSV